MKHGVSAMKVNDLISALLVTVVGGLLVSEIRKRMDGNPDEISSLIPSAGEEAEGEVYA